MKEEATFEIAHELSRLPTNLKFARTLLSSWRRAVWRRAAEAEQHCATTMFQLLCEMRQMLDYRTPDVGGIPGLTFNTDSNANAGNRIE